MNMSVENTERKIYSVIQNGVRENLKHDVLSEKDIKILKGIVYKFIKTKELVIVGDEAIKFYRPRDYREIELQDLDKIKNLPITVHVYSPNAITDAKDLGKVIHEKGYEHVSISEIAEYKTYVLDVEFKTVVKISYINGYVFRNIPVVESGGVRYITPEYLLVGIYYKYITPRLNVGEWKANIKYEEALFNRELFRTDKVRSKLKPLFPETVGEEHKKILGRVLEYLIGSGGSGGSECILTGLLAYNLMVLGMGGQKGEMIDNVSYVSVLCDGLEDRVNEIVELIGKGNSGKCVRFDSRDFKKVMKRRNDGINECPELAIEETAPLLIYFGEGRRLYYQGELLVELIELPTCFNYNLVGQRGGKEGGKEGGKGGLKVSNFHQLVWFLLLQKFFIRDRNVINNYRLLINQLIKMRVDYLKKEELSGLEKGIAQVFQGDCIGPNVNYKFLYHLGFWERTRKFRFKF